MDGWIKSSLCLCGALLLLSGVGLAGATEVTVGGGGAALHTVFEPIKPHFEKATGITLINLQSSPKGGLAGLLAGKIDVAVAAHSLESMVAALRKDGVDVDPAALVATEIGINRTVLLVHPTNRVGKLSKAQIKDIFTGRVGNWKDVGGDDKEIVVVWGSGTPGQNADFTRRVLDGEGVTREALATTSYADIRDTVAATPEAVGIDPFSIADASVRTIECDPPLATAIIAVTMGRPSPNVQRLFDYVAGEGRSRVRQ